MTEIAVADAHAVIWYGARLWKRLSPRARRVFQEAEEGRATIFVPTLALVEVSEAAWNGRISLRGGFTSWSTQLFRSPQFFPVDLTPEIVLRAEEFYAIPERGDRLIAATAAHLGYPLITRDPAIAKAAGVELVW